MKMDVRFENPTGCVKSRKGARVSLEEDDIVKDHCMVFVVGLD